MAHILSGGEWPAVTPAPPAPPWPHGWSCPGCGHSFAPWIAECSHCPEGNARLLSLMRGVVPPPASAAHLAIPAGFMSSPHYYLTVRIGDEWADVIPGLQCRIGNIGEQFADFRLKPAEDAP